MAKSKSSYGSIGTEENGLRSANSLCTVFQTTSNIFTVMTGAGMLSLPYAAACLGWSSVFVIMIVASIYFYTYTVLAESMRHLSQTDLDYETIDYFVLAKISFGDGGDKLVMCVLFLELLLALVSFFINIGANLHLVIGIKVREGILLAAIVAAALSLLSMKNISYVTSVCNILTFGTVISLFVSVAELPTIASDTQVLNFSGLSLSLGLMSFCFGGHGAYPKIFQSMAEPTRYREAVFLTAALVVPLYISIMVVGYYGYGSSVQAVVSANIGRSIQGHNLHHGTSLRYLAAVGIVSNLQVTAPILLLTLKDLVHSALTWHHTSTSDVTISVSILLVAAVLAVTLRDSFAFVCGLVGSFTTVTNSVVLPLLFYRCVCGQDTQLPARTSVLHGILLVLAGVMAVTGTGSSLCGIFARDGVEKWQVCRLLLPS